MLLNMKTLNIHLHATPHARPALKYLLSKVDRMEEQNRCNIESIPTGLDHSECFAETEAEYFRAALKNERITCENRT